MPRFLQTAPKEVERSGELAVHASVVALVGGTRCTSPEKQQGDVSSIVRYKEKDIALVNRVATCEE